MNFSYQQIESAIKKKLNVESFRSVQSAVIKDLFSTKNVIAIMPTGAGKSLTYQALASVTKGVIVVVEPFIALIRDQMNEAASLGLVSASLHSDMTEDEAEQLRRSITMGSLRLLFVTPERFNDADFVALCKSVSVTRYVIDEAHSVSAMGDGFRPAYSTLGSTIADINEYKTGDGLKPAPVLFLSATLTDHAESRLIDSFKLLPGSIVRHVHKSDRGNIRIDMRRVPAREKVLKAVELARRTSEYGAMLIYVSDKTTAAILHERLSLRNLNVRLFHASLSADEKKLNMEWFKTSDNGVLISTSALSAGFNKPNIRTVLHYQTPRSVEEYAQEIGRAGRDGQPAEAVLFYDTAADAKLNNALLKSSAPDLRYVAAFAFAINQKFSEGEVFFSLNIKRFRLEYVVLEISAGAIRTMLGQAKSAGAIDFKEVNGIFDIAIFGPVNQATMMTLLSNNENVQLRYQKMLELIACPSCKHQFIAGYFSGVTEEPRRQCSCCYTQRTVAFNVQPAVLRSRLMQLRSQYARRYGVSAFTMLPAGIIEQLILRQPTTISEMASIEGVSELQLQVLGEAMLEIMRAA